MLVAVSVALCLFVAASCGDDEGPPPTPTPTPLTNCQKLCNEVGFCYAEEAKGECSQECSNTGFTDNQLGCTATCLETCPAEEGQVQDCISACFGVVPPDVTPPGGINTVKEVLESNIAGEVTLVGITFEEIDPDDEYKFTDGTGVVVLDFNGPAPSMNTPIIVTGTVASSEIDVPTGGWELL